MSKPNSNDFYEKVYKVVAEIPFGRVTTYGAIARYLGIGGSARMVGYALNQTLRTDGPDLPCHRVVNRLGELSGKIHFGNGVMESLLEQEGVEFLDENTIDLKKHYWDPSCEL